jgi:predicted nucleotidyltransferase
MQALASYGSQLHPAIQAALTELEESNQLDGLVRARPYSLNGRTYAKFMWADWPQDRSASLTEKVEAFLSQHHDLEPLDERCEEWAVVFGGETDGEAAAEIGKHLMTHFPEPGRDHWVTAERDGRGKVVAWSFTKGLGEILWHVSWRHVGAEPSVRAEPAASRIDSQDMQKLNAAIRDVHLWASSRIQPILDAVREKFKALYGERFRGLYVYGSYARLREAGIELPIDSDLDVALILSDFASVHEERERFGDIVYDISLEHGLAVSVVPVREAEYRNKTSAFTREISSYAVPAR